LQTHYEGQSNIPPHTNFLVRCESLFAPRHGIDQDGPG
jgi:hypothetical protein